MSRAVVYGSLLAAVALVVSCGPKGSENRAFVGKIPIDINISCDANPITVSLTDKDGNSAWVVDTDNRQIKWQVKKHVTINAIQGKSVNNVPAPLPIDVDANEHGGEGGKAYKAKVKNVSGGGPPDGAIIPYAIDATCESSTGKPIRLLIDPEMIVR
jgi:hypothetical protein